MDKKKRMVLLFFIIVILSFGLTGYSASTGYSHGEAYAIRDGSGHGSLFSDLTVSCRSTLGNNWGIVIGKICVVFFSIVGLGMALDENENENIGCLSAIGALIKGIWYWIVLISIVVEIVKCSGSC